jgi:hypothetical protein
MFTAFFWRSILLYLVWFAGVFPAIFPGSISAQTAIASTAESLDALQSKYEGVRSSVIAAIQSIPDHPDSIETGTLASTLETAANLDLASLLTQLQQQKEILAKRKHSLINNPALSENDKEELRSALKQQSKPLESLISKVTTFQGAISDLRQSQLSVWKDTYNSFKEIDGSAKASAKIRMLTDQFCEPYVPAKPVATPQRDVAEVSTTSPESARTTHHRKRQNAQDSDNNQTETSSGPESQSFTIKATSIPITTTTYTNASNVQEPDQVANTISKLKVVGAKAGEAGVKALESPQAHSIEHAVWAWICRHPWWSLLIVVVVISMLKM